MTSRNNFPLCGSTTYKKNGGKKKPEYMKCVRRKAAEMEIKIFPVLLYALILLWTIQTIHGYTGPYVHGGQSGRKKKSEIMQKVRK